MLGENLVAKGFISQAQLDKAIEEQRKESDKRLGEILVKLGYVTKEQVEASL